MVNERDPWDSAKDLRRECHYAFKEVDSILRSQHETINLLMKRVNELEETIVELQLLTTPTESK